MKIFRLMGLMVMMISGALGVRHGSKAPFDVKKFEKKWNINNWKEFADAIACIQRRDMKRRVVYTLF